MKGKEGAVSPEERAVNDFTELIYKLYQEGNMTEFGKSFRSRSREIPSFLYEVGSIPALSFIYAKTEDADKGIYKLFLNYTKKRAIEGMGKLNSKEGGYAAYLYLLLLETSRLVPDRKIDPESPLSCINSLIGSEVLAILPSLLMPYLLEIKRLAEALLPSER